MIPSRFAHIAAQLFNKPHAIMPAKAEIIVAGLAERLGLVRLSFDGVAARPTPGAFYMDDDGPSHDPSAEKGYDMVGPVAVIGIEGTLVKKYAGTLRPESGMTGYNGIAQNFLTAMVDPAVKAIALDIDSPGGEVAGCFDLVDSMRLWKGKKPVWAILDEMACSAAYALASVADKITVPRTGIAGSIGAVMMHVDLSRALQGAGIDVTFIQYGAKKTDGASEKPLAPDAKKEFQAEIDAIGDLFVGIIAKNRGLKPAAVRDQEAGVFMGEEAVNAGLADFVAAPDAAIYRLIDSL